MTPRATGSLAAVGAFALLVLGVALPLAAPAESTPALRWTDGLLPMATWALLFGAAWRALLPTPTLRSTLLLLVLAVAGACGYTQLLPSTGDASAAGGYWLALLGTLLLAAVTVQRLAASTAHAGSPRSPRRCSACGCCSSGRSA